MRLSGSIRFVAFLAATLPLARPVPAQDRSQTFSGSAEVVAVEVPVQVLLDGEPVRGLKASDFEVYEGKNKQTVTGFETLDLGTLAPGTPAAQVPVAGRRHFLFLFDLTFSEPQAIVRARAAAKDLLTELHPTDLAAVATFSTLMGPQLVIGFTPDRAQVAKAIDTLGVPQLVERGDDPLRLALDTVKGRIRTTADVPKINYSLAETMSAEATAGRDEALVETFSEYSAVAEHADRSRQAEMVQRFTASFTLLARLIATVEGRKHVVLLSQGYDGSLLTGAVDEEQRKQMQEEALSGERALRDDSNDRFGDTKSANRVEKMLEEFRRADCTIQAVDISGLRAAADQGPRLAATGKDSLLQLAKDTGGQLFENFNDLSAAMGRMLKNTSVTYVLTIQPEDVRPGEYRKLEVRLKNGPRGARVVARPGYYSQAAYAQQGPLEKLLGNASRLLGEESAGALKAEVLAAPFPRPGEPSYVPVLIEVEGSALLQGSQGAQLPVEVYIYALDPQGAVVDFITQTVGLDLAKADPALREAGFKFYGHLNLDPGRYDLRVLVRNGSTGASGLRVLPLQVPEPGAQPLVLLPAFFPDPLRHWLLVREAPRTNEAEVPYPFLRSGEPYVPASRLRLSPGAEAPVVLLGFGVKPGQWKVASQVLSPDGNSVRAVGRIKIEKATPGGEGAPAQAEGTFKAPDLPPGDYLLKVTLTDGAGAVGSSVSPFRLDGAILTTP